MINTDVQVKSRKNNQIKKCAYFYKIKVNELSGRIINDFIAASRYIQ